MKYRIPDALVHFFGFHLFYYAIGICAYIWFMAHFSTEINGNPMRLSIRYAWPTALLVYLPLAIYLYRRSTDKPTSPTRLAKYGASLLVYSFLTGATTSGYIAVLSVVAEPLETDLAHPVTSAFSPGAGATYQTSGGKQFRVETDTQHKSLTIHKSRFGYYYWVDNKI